MKDNALIDLLATILEQGLAHANLNMPVVQLNQPTQQGIEPNTVYFQKLFDDRYGWAANSKQVRYKYDYKTDPTGNNPVGSPSIGIPNTVDPLNGATNILNDETYVADVDQQQVITTFQICAFFAQIPGQSATQPTASDVVNYLAKYLSHRQIMKQFRAQNVGLLRIVHIGNQQFHNDFSQFQALPAFKVELTHVREFSLEINEIDSFSGRVFVVNDEVNNNGN